MTEDRPNLITRAEDTRRWRQLTFAPDPSPRASRILFHTSRLTWPYRFLFGSSSRWPPDIFDGRQLTAARALAELSMRDLAEAANVTGRTIHRLEIGGAVHVAATGPRAFVTR